MRGAVLWCAVLPLTASSATGIAFNSPLFSNGMVIQRGVGTKVWGSGAVAGAKVTVAAGHATASVSADPNGSWKVSLPALEVAISTTLSVTDGTTTATLSDVAVGDVLLCGGQSNMVFGMCAAHSQDQTPQQALDTLAPVRIYDQWGTAGPGGGTDKAMCNTSSGEPSITPLQKWVVASATNAGGFSANCLLTASRLHKSLGGKVPVGAVESCVGGTQVTLWTPPDGDLWKQHMEPLLPMNFRAVLWDQGEADEHGTNSTYYAVEFPKMIIGWRAAFETPDLPFIYVEIAMQNGAEEPKESSFWLAQRVALKLKATGFVVTTDIDRRGIHPPDKQDIADRLLLEIQRLAYGKAVVSRGPELVSVSRDHDGGNVTFHFSNSTLSSHAGIFVGSDSSCGQPTDSVVMGINAHTSMGRRAYSIDGATVTVACSSVDDIITINGDRSTCFLYGPTHLPAPMVEFWCNSSVSW